MNSTRARSAAARAAQAAIGTQTAACARRCGLAAVAGFRSSQSLPSRPEGHTIDRRTGRSLPEGEVSRRAPSRPSCAPRLTILADSSAVLRAELRELRLASCLFARRPSVGVVLTAGWEWCRGGYAPRSLPARAAAACVLEQATANMSHRRRPASVLATLVSESRRTGGESARHRPSPRNGWAGRPPRPRARAGGPASRCRMRAWPAGSPRDVEIRPADVTDQQARSPVNASHGCRVPRRRSETRIRVVSGRVSRRGESADDGVAHLDLVRHRRARDGRIHARVDREVGASAGAFHKRRQPGRGRPGRASRTLRDRRADHAAPSR